MVTVPSGRISVTVAGMTKLPVVGVSYPVELRDADDRPVLILHYADAESADAAAFALAGIAVGLVAITDPSI